MRQPRPAARNERLVVAHLPDLGKELDRKVRRPVYLVQLARVIEIEIPVVIEAERRVRAGDDRRSSCDALQTAGVHDGVKTLIIRQQNALRAAADTEVFDP